MVTKRVLRCENDKGVALGDKLAAMKNLFLLQNSQGDYNLSQQRFQCRRDLIDVAGENFERSSLCSTQMYEGMLLYTLCVAPSDAAPAA
jgi:hypothetical protein